MRGGEEEDVVVEGEEGEEQVLHPADFSSTVPPSNQRTVESTGCFRMVCTPTVMGKEGGKGGESVPGLNQGMADFRRSNRGTYLS